LSGNHPAINSQFIRQQIHPGKGEMSNNYQWKRQEKPGSRRKKLLLLATLVIAVSVVVWATTSPSAAKFNPMNLFAGKGGLLAAAGPVVQLPPILPDDTCERAGSMLGAPVEQDEYGRVWAVKDFQLAVVTDVGCNITGTTVWVEDKQQAETVDKIVLGKTTYSEAEKILKPRMKDDSEWIDLADEGIWEASIELDPTPAFPYKVIYRSDLPPEVEAKIKGDLDFPDFKNLPMTEYSIDLADKKDIKP
jgi:hypothetical protein